MVRPTLRAGFRRLARGTDLPPVSLRLSTDGIGRGLGGSPSALLDELEALRATGVENPARGFIERAIRQRPSDFDDNLTLAVIGGE